MNTKVFTKNYKWISSKNVWIQSHLFRFYKGEWGIIRVIWFSRHPRSFLLNSIEKFLKLTKYNYTFYFHVSLIQLSGWMDDWMNEWWLLDEWKEIEFTYHSSLLLFNYSIPYIYTNTVVSPLKLWKSIKIFQI